MRLRFDSRMGDDIGYLSLGEGFDLWIVPRSGHQQKAAALEYQNYYCANPSFGLLCDLQKAARANL